MLCAGVLNADSNAVKSRRAAKLSTSITEAEFDNGYWYADDLKKFAEEIGVPSSTRLRKDELEQAVKHFLRTGEARSFAKRAMTKSGPRDIDLGLRLDLPVVHHTSNRQTKDFIEHEAAKLEPGFKRESERDTCSTVGAKNNLARAAGSPTAIYPPCY